MTKPTGVGRGGRRKNPGGRPRKAKPAPSVETQMAAFTALAQLPAPALNALLDTAYHTLNQVMMDGEHDAPRVSAARAVLAEAARRAGAGKSGKKGEQADAARAQNAGRFATPSGPRLIVDNT